MCLGWLEVECLFVLPAIYHAPNYAQCQCANAERGEYAHEDMCGRIRQRYSRAEGHIGGEAYGTLWHEREQRAGDDPPGNLPDATQPRSLLKRIATGVQLPLAAVGRVHAFASFDWQPHFVEPAW